MSNVFYPNFPIPSATSVMQVVWKLTRAMKKSGWTTVAHSDGTTKTAPGTNNDDSWGSDPDPSNDVYPAAFDTAKAPWIVMSGPQTLKIPLSANPTGTLLRGETITQAVSAAEGELLGYVWSVGDASGWAVVLPRTGTFDNSNIVTGSTSAATFTPTGTIVIYNREIMFGKTTANDTLNGQIWYVCCDPVGESTFLFSYLATQTGCTATVPPGSGGTSNGFPTFGNAGSPTGGAIAIRGVGGATTATPWFGTTSGYSGNAQIVSTNAIPSAGVSADGSFYIAMDGSATNGLSGLAYQRVDDGEPGDVDPFVWIHVTSGQVSTWVRTSNINVYSVHACFDVQQFFTSGQQISGCGYLARGVDVSSSVRDIAVGYNFLPHNRGTGEAAICTPAAAVRTWNHPSAASTPIVREKLLVWCTGQISGSFHQFKGKLRWMFVTSSGSKLQTSDSNTFVCVSSGTLNNWASLWLGPYDGSSTPT